MFTSRYTCMLSHYSDYVCSQQTNEAFLPLSGMYKGYFLTHRCRDNKILRLDTLGVGNRFLEFREFNRLGAKIICPSYETPKSLKYCT